MDHIILGLCNVRDFKRNCLEVRATLILSRDSHGVVCGAFTASNAVVRAHRSITVAAQNQREAGIPAGRFTAHIWSHSSTRDRTAARTSPARRWKDDRRARI